jgi:hypothetical protein
VGTDLSARRVRNLLSADKVGSSASVQDIGEVKFEFVGSQLIAKRVRGDLVIEKVGSNVVVQDIDGQVRFDHIGGSLHLREISGGLTAELGGTATIDFSPVSWQAYDVQAGGGIRCNVPADANARFEIDCAAQRIRIKNAEGAEVIKERHHTCTMGDGAAPVKLTAGGNISIVSQGSGMEDAMDFEVDFGGEIGSLADEIVEQTAQQIEAQMEMLEEHLNAQMAGLSMSIGAAGMSDERMQEVEKRLEEAKARAAQRAEEASRRAQEKMERKVAAAQRRAERKARAAAARQARKQRKRSDFSAPNVIMTPPPPVAAKDPVSEEERMMILQMLQDRKIDVEQAEQLLSALEGK